ncbi:MAG TPA: class I SAM-dependent methyltransferase [Ktedonobacterales bacterium]|nr:class I SAM-dependent methyltransferase [Ktedonobacterales bacterium]
MRWFGWSRRNRSAANQAGALTETSDGFPVVVVGGRLRKAGVPYAMPADLAEINRLDFQHYLLRHIFQGNYAAPIRTPASILDVGSGTGRWAHEMAELFPMAKVVGTDITPPSSETSAIPGTPDPRPHNYTFIAANVLEGLPFPDASFDFVHMRLLYSAIPHTRWPSVVSELVRVTRLGGWIESVESAVALNPGPMLSHLSDTINGLIAHRGIDPLDGARVGEMLRAAGLTGIVEQRIDVPLGSYGGRIGTMMATDLLAGIEGFGGLLVQMNLLTAEQFQQMHANLRAEFASPDNRAVGPFYVAYGRRRRQDV